MFLILWLKKLFGFDCKVTAVKERKKNTKVTEEIKAEVINLYFKENDELKELGLKYNYSDIGKELDISKSTVGRIVREHRHNLKHHHAE